MLYLCDLSAFSRALHVTAPVISSSQITVQLTSVRHISRQCERVINMATSFEFWGKIRDGYKS